MNSFTVNKVKNFPFYFISFHAASDVVLTAPASRVGYPGYKDGEFFTLRLRRSFTYPCPDIKRLRGAHQTGFYQITWGVYTVEIKRLRKKKKKITQRGVAEFIS